MRPAKLFALAVTPLLIGTGVKQEVTPVPGAATSLVVTPEWLAQHLDDPDLIILEAGERDDYRNGHIRRARPVDIMAFHTHGTELPPPADLISAVEKLGISNTSRVVLYGDIHGVSIFWMMLEYLGIGDRALVLDGGKFGWLATGKPLTTEEPSYLAGKFVPHLRPGIMVDAAWILAHLKDPKLALIDARSPAEFRGDPGHVASPGHIPGAVNLDWERTFDSTGRLLPADSLRALFTQAEYAPGDRLVVYCTVGMRASHIYFVARHLGLTPLLYQGSMNDWASDPARPIMRAGSP